MTGCTMHGLASLFPCFFICCAQSVATVKSHAAGSTKSDEYMKAKQATVLFYKRLLIFSSIFAVPALALTMVVMYLPGTR
jgi:hypothetical protein